MSRTKILLILLAGLVVLAAGVTAAAQPPLNVDDLNNKVWTTTPIPKDSIWVFAGTVTNRGASPYTNLLTGVYLRDTTAPLVPADISYWWSTDGTIWYGPFLPLGSDAYPGYNVRIMIGPSGGYPLGPNNASTVYIKIKANNSLSPIEAKIIVFTETTGDYGYTLGETILSEGDYPIDIDLEIPATVGLDNVLDLDWWAGELNKADKVLVQKIYITDNDNSRDDDPLIISQLVVTMCQEGESPKGKHKDYPGLCKGTAKVGQDIVGLDIYLLKESGFGASSEALIASATYPAFTDFPIVFGSGNIPFTGTLADRTLPDDGEGILKVVVTISNEPKDSHWIQFTTKIHWSEGGWGGYAEVTDSHPEHISNPGWVVQDKNKFNSPIKPGVTIPIQEIDVDDDHDGNSNPVQLINFKVTNLGTAKNEDIEALYFTNCQAGDKRVVYGTATAFNQEVALSGVATPDDEEGSYCVEVKVKYDPAKEIPTYGRTFLIETYLTLQEGAVETQQTAAAKDSEKETIAPPGCEITKFDDSMAPATLELGALEVAVEKFTCTDSDPDDADVVLSKIEIRNDGTATSDDIASIEVLDEKGNILGQATKFGTIPLKNPDGSPVIVEDGACSGCQEDPGQPSSRTLTVKLSINKHARSHDQEERNTIRLAKIITVEEQTGETYSYMHTSTRTIQIGGVTLALVGFGNNNVLHLKPGDEGSVDVLTTAPDLADIQVGGGIVTTPTPMITGAAVLFNPVATVNASVLIKVTDVIPCNTQHGNYPQETPYEILSWTQGTADFDGDDVDEIAVQFTAALRPDRSQQPQQGCIANIKFEYINTTEEDINVLWYQDRAPDVFRDILGHTIPIANQTGGLIDVNASAEEAKGQGDVNGDGKVDITDAKCVALYALAVPLSPSCGLFNAQAADVALPAGVIDITDARVIAQKALGLIALQVPQPAAFVTTSASGEGVEFVARGNVRQLRVRVFDLAGRTLFDSGLVSGKTLHWNLLNTRGQPLANGTYLYLVTTVGYDGRAVKSEVRKLVILR